MAARLGSRPRQVDLGCLGVDAVYLAGSDGLGQAHGDGAWPATEVEHSLAGLQVGKEVEGMGVSAAPVEELLELIAVSHGVVGGGRRALRHGYNSQWGCPVVADAVAGYFPLYRPPMGVGIVARKGYAARGCVLGAVLGVHIGVWVPAEDGVDDTAARLVGNEG